MPQVVADQKTKVSKVASFAPIKSLPSPKPYRLTLLQSTFRSVRFSYQMILTIDT